MGEFPTTWNRNSNWHNVEFTEIIELLCIHVKSKEYRLGRPRLLKSLAWSEHTTSFLSLGVHYGSAPGPYSACSYCHGNGMLLPSKPHRRRKGEGRQVKGSISFCANWVSLSEEPSFIFYEQTISQRPTSVSAKESEKKRKIWPKIILNNTEVLLARKIKQREYRVDK